MHYPGPSVADLANVKALNRAFLDTLRTGGYDSAVLDEAAPSFRSICAALSDAQVERLSATPFLLFSLRERDADFWEPLFDPESRVGTGDLFAFAQVRDSNDARLADAALGFLWMTAGRNAYSARIVSGAPLSWCERLADSTLMSVLAFAGSRDDLLLPRFAGREDVWHKLLGAGVSSERDVRQAAQLTVLQTMLTQDMSPNRERLSAAACRMPGARIR